MNMPEPANADRRKLLGVASALPLLASPPPLRAQGGAVRTSRRVRPGEPGWPSDAEWQAFGSRLSPGALVRVHSPWAPCTAAADSPACSALFRQAKNPWFLGDEVALTQTFGWVDAWTSRPSVYAVAAANTADVAAAVDFARTRKLRLVVKGGGHSYQGTSNAPDSLLVWTRRMKRITVHDAFVPQGCGGQAAPVRAASIDAGALWAHAYDAITTRAGGYVQGGGCMTVGVAGLVQSGGFGSFSKRFGLAAANLLEAQVVTADGRVCLANACTNPELFWALKGGGGGSFGVVTRVTLRVHELPQTFGAVNFTVRASSPAAFRRLIALTLDFYARALLNPHWGEQVRFRPENVMNVSMVFQGMERHEAVQAWQPFLDTLQRQSQDFSIDFAPLKIVSTSARSFWSPTWVKRALGFIRHDDRPGAPQGNVFWPGDEGQAGQFLHGYQSNWLPAALLRPDRQAALADALFAATRHWGVALHFNKGLAGAPADVIAAARDTAMHPAVLDAFALLICGANEQPCYPGVAGHEPDVALARDHSQRIELAMAQVRKVVAQRASYLSESNFFEPGWQQSFWGGNYARLLAAKERYDPDGLFFVHHGVGSEHWSEDGITRRT